MQSDYDVIRAMLKRAGMAYTAGKVAGDRFIETEPQDSDEYEEAAGHFCFFRFTPEGSLIEVSGHGPDATPCSEFATRTIN